MKQTSTEKTVTEAAVQKERRSARRAKISRTVLVSPSDPKYREEVQSSVDASRNGLYFTTQANHYYVGMHLVVILGYAPNDPCKSQSFGEVVRVDQLDDGCFGVAVKIRLR
jgi:hypothetical protein